MNELPIVVLRRAVKDDLNEIMAIELACFKYDRISRRSMRQYIQRALILVADGNPRIVGYGLVLLRHNSPRAYLFSLASIKPGVGSLLLRALEAEAWMRGRTYMRLEVRPDNERAIGLYTKLGYRKLDTVMEFYEDRSPAFRFEKQRQSERDRLSQQETPTAQEVPDSP